MKTPFCILVDTAESLPYEFLDLTADADRKYVEWEVQRDFICLGRHPNSLGDYSIDGAVGHVAIERKSMEDAWGTLLGWPTGWEQDRELPGRRERFECELANLDRIPHSLVIVEASIGECVRRIPQWGVRDEAGNAKIFWRTVISYQQRFPNVQWMFADSRRMAEVYVFDFLYRVWEKDLLQHERRNGKRRRVGAVARDFGQVGYWL